MFGNRGPWLGQVPLVLGPSSWGAGMVPLAPSSPFAGAYAPYDPVGTPPYWGEWGSPGDCGRVGPFDTIDEAFRAAAAAAGEHGATALPGDGWAQVKDAHGKGVGPIT
jgi:hypothetical protein